MEKESDNSRETASEPAESFGVEFLNTKNNEVRSAFSLMGDFIFSGSSPAGDNEVYFTGERADGTKIRITVTKGEAYKSPAEIAAAARADKQDSKS